jgi:tRNA U34 2-thiouridine synthase MnmA/TrmU
VGERFYLQQKEGARNMSKAYTEKQVALMILAYENGNTDAERKTIMEGLAIELGKTVGSIRAKLVAVGHYIKLTPKTIENKNVESKSDICMGIRDLLNEELRSLSNLTKIDLEVLRKNLK